MLAFNWGSDVLGFGFQWKKTKRNNIQEKNSIRKVSARFLCLLTWHTSMSVILEVVPKNATCPFITVVVVVTTVALLYNEKYLDI